MSTIGIAISPATLDDLQAINEIYNHYVVSSPITFDVEPMRMDRRREWFAQFDERGRHRLLVARVAEVAIGYAHSSAVRPRLAYETSVETSVYLAPDHTGRGVGRSLYDVLFRELANEDVHRAYAGIAMPNPPSVRLHERFGFRLAGYFTQQGRKFGRYWDVAWYERRFP